MKIISDQVSRKEIDIVLREIKRVVDGGTKGDIVELGCFVGTTSLFISDFLKNVHSNKTFHVYDSFAGLPEKTDKDLSPAGEQFKAGELSTSKTEFIKNYRRAKLPLPAIHKSWFENLTNNELPQQICFAFLDGDYYRSIQTSLKLIWPKLSGGAVVIVDDYANEALPGAGKAVDEWLVSHPTKLRVESSLAILLT